MDELSEGELLERIAALKHLRSQIKDFENRWIYLLNTIDCGNFIESINVRLERLRNKLAEVRGE